MEKKRVISLVVFVLLIFAGFATYFFVYTKQSSIQGDVITNGRDAHGCLVNEGYGWNNTQESCINDWLRQKYQIVDFQSCTDAGYALSENNTTGSLQCQALNGSIFVNSSTALIIINSSEIGNGNTTFVGNFTINQTAGNETNLTNSTNNS
ncbi:MAG: hypothetical protein WAU65_02125 [Candidatus Nanoarchaeia archaeon]